MTATIWAIPIISITDDVYSGYRKSWTFALGFRSSLLAANPLFDTTKRLSRNFTQFLKFQSPGIRSVTLLGFYLDSFLIRLSREKKCNGGLGRSVISNATLRLTKAFAKSSSVRFELHYLLPRLSLRRQRRKLREPRRVARSGRSFVDRFSMKRVYLTAIASLGLEEIFAHICRTYQ